MTLPARARRILRSIRQAIPSGVVLGRRSSGVGPVEFIPLNEIQQAQLDSISTTRGAILYRAAAAWAALAPGTSGQFLRTNGAGNDPTWAAAGGGGGGMWEFVETVSATAAASMDINIPDADRVALLIDIQPATDDVKLEGQVTDDGFTTVESGSVYKWQHTRTTVGGAAVQRESTTTPKTVIEFVESLGNASDERFVADLIIHSPANSAKQMLLDYQGASTSFDNNPSRLNGMGAYLGATAVNGIRFAFSAGNIASGKVHVYKVVIA